VKLNIVPARTGIQWVKLGVQTFFRQPLALAGLFFMYMAAVIVLSAIPLLGPLLGGLLVPAATLGLMAATAEATTGKFPMPTVLLSAFRAGRQRARSMLVLGAIYAGLSMLASVLGALIAGTPAPAPQGTAVGQPQLDAGMLIGLALHTPLFLLFWHAPALVHWHGVPPGKSLFFSAVACLRNFGAFLAYGIAWSVVFMAVAFLLGMLGLLFGGATLARSVMMPAALLMAAMFSTSIYFTFRDCFLADPDPPTGENNDTAPA
jgi:hypothetical protein